MEFGFTDEQKMFREQVREFMEKEFPLTFLRELENDEAGWSRELYKKMAELGWLGFMLPEEFGGYGFGCLEVAIFYEELGRALFPSPHFTTMILAGHAIAEAGTAAQKGLLEKMAASEVTISVARFEPEGGLGPDAVRVSAKKHGNDLVIDGVKLYVPYANSVDYLLVLVRNAEPKGDAEGVSMILVDAGAKGISLAPHRVIHSERSFEVTFEGVRVPAENLVGEEGRAWPLWLDMDDRGKVASAAEMTGGAEKALELAVQYAKERYQFGQPIGKFQAIQQLLAPPYMEIDGAKLLTYEAAWKIDNGLPARDAAAMAKAWANHVFFEATRAGHQTMGGFGFMMESDMQLFFRRARGLEINRGMTDQQLDVIAEGL
jgi:alkylation response protein AidB-like acyl-CoA dehydrogenase